MSGFLCTGDCRSHQVRPRKRACLVNHAAAFCAPLQVRPYLMADGGNVEFVEIDGPIVRLKLQGACGSCPSSATTMTMGIERRLRERIPEVLEIEQVRSTRCVLLLRCTCLYYAFDMVLPSTACCFPVLRPKLPVIVCFPPSR
jgi:Fe-S cluster biogenesis protein NfuA